MLGIQVSKNDVNAMAGDIASALNHYYNRAVELHQFIELIGAAGLEGAGFTPEEAQTLVTAMADLNFQKAESFDSSQAVRQLYGMGIR